MTISLLHTTQSTKPQTATAGIMSKNEWNEEHTITMAASRILGRSSTGVGVVQELTAAVVLSLLSLVVTSVDNTVPRFDGVAGGMQTSGLKITDADILTFPTTTGDKIYVSENGASDRYGLGVASNELRVFSSATGTSHISFGAGESGVFTEWARLALTPADILTSAGIIYGSTSIPLCGSAVQFNSSHVYPLSVISGNPYIVGAAGCSIGSSTVGQTFSVRFTSTSLSGSPITITYTAIGGDTTATIATALCAAINANTTIRNATTARPIFAQAFSGSAIFNIQWDGTINTLTLASVGTGTVTIPATVAQLDFVVMELGRAASGWLGAAGDALFAFDFTGQSSTGSRDTHYANIGIIASNITAGAQAASIVFSTANNAATVAGRLVINRGLYLLDTAGAVPSGTDKGAGSINFPMTIAATNSGIWFGGAHRIYYNDTASQLILDTSGIINISASTGVGINVTPTGSGFQSALGFFASGVQVPTTGAGIGLAGGATPCLSARNYGTATNLPLTLQGTVFSPLSNDLASLGTASLSWSDLFLASGAVVNIANGNWIATHSSGILTVGTGDLRVTTAGTNTASVVTLEGTQTLSNKSLTRIRTQMISELTIASGVITVTGGYHSVDTESDGASDDLDTINGGVDGAIVILRADNDARTVVVKDTTGNLQLAGDMSLTHRYDTLTLIYDGTLSVWMELARADTTA